MFIAAGPRYLIASLVVAFFFTTGASAQNPQNATAPAHGKVSARDPARPEVAGPGLVGAEISFLFFDGSIHKVMTDAEGKYRTTLPIGKYKAVCNMKDHESYSDLYLPAWSNKTAQDQTHNFFLKPDPGAAPVAPVNNPQTMIVTGYSVHVTAGNPPQPVNNATVTFFNANGQSKVVKAYPNTNIHLIGVPPAPYRVVVTAQGHPPFSQMLAPSPREGATRVNALLK